MTVRLSGVALALAAAAVLGACAQHETLPVAPAGDPLAAQSVRRDRFPVNGAQYTYSDVQHEAPVPGASSTPPSTRWTDTVTVRTGQSFGGRTGLIAYDHSQIDPARGQYTEYHAWVAADGGRALETDGAKALPVKYPVWYRQIYTKPQVALVEPFAKGRHWDASGAFHAISRFHPGLRSDGVIDQTWYGDGSYVTTTRQYGPHGKPTGSSAIAVRSDGSASSIFHQNGCFFDEEISVPVAGGGGEFAIPVRIETHDCEGGPAPTSTTAPDWYPGGKLPPSPLDRATASDDGYAPLPAWCSVPANIAAGGEKIVRVESSINPLGLQDLVQETSFYSQSVGLLCRRTVTKSEVHPIPATGNTIVIGGPSSTFDRIEVLTAYTP